MNRYAHQFLRRAFAPKESSLASVMYTDSCILEQILLPDRAAHSCLCREALRHRVQGVFLHPRKMPGDFCIDDHNLLAQACSSAFLRKNGTDDSKISHRTFCRDEPEQIHFQCEQEYANHVNERFAVHFSLQSDLYRLRQCFSHRVMQRKV